MSAGLLFFRHFDYPVVFTSRIGGTAYLCNRKQLDAHSWYIFWYIPSNARHFRAGISVQHEPREFADGAGEIVESPVRVAGRLLVLRMAGEFLKSPEVDPTAHLTLSGQGKRFSDGITATRGREMVCVSAE